MKDEQAGADTPAHRPDEQELCIAGPPPEGNAAPPPADDDEHGHEAEPEADHDYGYEPWSIVRPPVGARPGTLAIPEDALEPRLRLMRYDEDTLEARSVDLDETLALLGATAATKASERRGVLWIDVQGFGDEQTLRSLGDALGLHPLMLEDVVHTQRPKVESFDQHLVLFARVVDPANGRSQDQVTFVLRRGVLVTFQARYEDGFDPVRTRIEVPSGRVRQAGADYLAYALLDALVDAFFPAVEGVGDQLTALEEETLYAPTRETVGKINVLRGQLVELRRAAAPLRELVTSLLRDESGVVDESVKTYLRDVQDHALHLTELIEMQREAANGLMNTYLSSVANRQNEVMKVLTLVTSIFIPLSFLAGLYGMNFAHMPELQWPWAYPALLSVMAAVGIGMLLYFRSRGWLPPLRRR